MAASVPWPSAVPEDVRGGISALQPLAAWTAGQIRFESVGVVLETVTPETATETGPSGSPAPGAGRPGTLADRLPPSTVLLMDLSAADSLVPGPGAAASPGVGGTPLPGLPGGSDSLLPFLGGAGDLSGLPGRAALIVTAAPDRSGTALVMELPSTSDGASIAQLLALLAFSGGSQDTYEGATILTIPLANLAGAVDPSGIETPPLPVGADAQLAMAVHGDLLVVGLGDAVVKAVIDVSEGATLADQEAYRTAMDAAGNAGLPEVFVDVRGLLPLAEAAARDHDPAMADRTGHWLESVSTIASRLSRVDGYVRSRTIITIE
jgi:hypothetical protein